jgi:hypothetical protein
VQIFPLKELVPTDCKAFIVILDNEAQLAKAELKVLTQLLILILVKKLQLKND